MSQRRSRTRISLIDATVKELEKVRAMVNRGKLKAKEKIGLRVGKVVNKYSGGVVSSELVTTPPSMAKQLPP